MILRRAAVRVVVIDGARYIRTTADQTKADNLANLLTY